MADEREEIARIIDPWAFGIVANIQHTERAADDRAKALAKADAILARQGPGPGEAVEAIIANVSDEDLRALASTYDTGRCRAVLRTVLRDALAATPAREA